MSEPAWVALGVQGGVVDWEGGWSAGVAYAPGDVVRWNGIDYIAVNPSTGQTPGAATPVIGGRELAYAEYSASVSVTAITEGAAQTVVSAPPIVSDGSPVLIEFMAPLAGPAAVANAILYVLLYEDGVSLGYLATIRNSGGAANMYVPIHQTHRRVPSGGSHTYSIRAYGTTTGAAVNVGAGSPSMPGFIRVTLEQPAALNITTRVSDPGYGTSLPASPVDGEEYTLVDSLTAPTYQWRFRYNAGSSVAYKWEFVGGPPTQIYVGTDQTTTTTATWLDLATVGPSFVVPRAGEYDVMFGSDTYHTLDEAQVFIGIAIGAGTPSTSKAMVVPSPNVSIGIPTGFGRISAAAGNELRMRYHSTQAGTAHWLARTLRVTPMRVA